MTSNTFTVITTTAAARIGDVVVATNHNDNAVVERGRLVDVRIDEIILEKDNGYRVALPVKEWSFAAAPPEPAAFVAVEAWCPGCASKPEDGTTPPSAEEIARVIYLHGLHVPEAPTTLPASCVAPECTWASDLKGIDLRDAFNAHVAEVIRALYAGHTLDSLLDARRKRIAELEAEVARLSALVANKQSVIDEDRADAKRNRERQAAVVADLRHAVALEVDRTNDANQRADQLAARVQELEVEAARLEHAIEESASGRIAYSELHEQLKAVATRFRLDRTVEPARIVDGLAERIRVLIVQREQFEAEVNRIAPVVDASGVRVNPIAHAAEVIRTTGGAVEIAGVRIERCDNKFARFAAVDLSPYTEAIDRAARLAAAAAAKERGRRIRTQERDAERKAAAGVRGDVRQATEGNQGS